jgi:curved DNA-binding protein CbpA
VDEVEAVDLGDEPLSGYASQGYDDVDEIGTGDLQPIEAPVDDGDPFAGFQDDMDAMPPPPPHDEANLREQLAAEVADLRQKDLFAVLGLTRDAGVGEIVQAYQQKARQYHPDHYSGVTSAEVRELATQLYDMVVYAHHTLSDTRDREQYLADLARGVQPEFSGESNNILAAEGKFQQGETLLYEGQFAEAHARFQEAVALYDQEGDFHAYLGWSRFQMEPDSRQAALEAIEALARAISLNPRSEKGYLFTGYVYKATGRTDLAERQFEKAIQANPGCEEALQELSLLGIAAKPLARR